tara:strand:- start:114 stop:755 length:642 start_codon:yes stop_codon:yes gene_type:complete
MATRSGIDAKAAIKLTEDHQNIIFAVKAEFDTSTLLLHSGGGDLVINSETYTGAGTLLAVSDIEDSNDLKSAGVTFQLSGMDSTVLSYAVSESYQNRPITLFLAFVSGGTDHVDGVMTLYKGRMTSTSITDSTTDGVMITLITENRLLDLERPCNYRYTKESQVALAGSGDTGFDAVEKLQDTDIIWGRGYGSGVDGGGGMIDGDGGGNQQHR